MQSCALIEQVSSLMDRHYALSTLLNHDRAEPQANLTRERLALFRRESYPTSSLSDLTSHATGGSEGFGIEPSLDELANPHGPQMPVEQELALLSVQLAPILDRTGRLMTDLAAVIGSSSLHPDDFASVSSSLLTNESGLSVSSRPALQIPVMPGQHQLTSMLPRLGSPNMDLHVHLLMSQRGGEELQDPCWRQMS
jgi:hypothetical protein